MFLLLAASLLQATDPAAAAAPVAPQPAPKKERRICRTADDSGSRMAQRVCKTESEWAASKDDKKSSNRATLSGAPTEND